MTDFLDMRRDDPYGASYPASITGGGGVQPAAPLTWTVAADASQPGTMSIAGTQHTVNVTDAAGTDQTALLESIGVTADGVELAWPGGLERFRVNGAVSATGGTALLAVGGWSEGPTPPVGAVVTLTAKPPEPISYVVLPYGVTDEYKFGPPWNDGTPEPTDLAAIQALGPLGQTTAWTTGQYVEDWGAGDHAYWDGSAWIQGEAP